MPLPYPFSYHKYPIQSASVIASPAGFTALATKSTTVWFAGKTPSGGLARLTAFLTTSSQFCTVVSLKVPSESPFLCCCVNQKIISSRTKMDSCCSSSLPLSGSVRQRAIAMIAGEKSPSVAKGPMSFWRLGVSRKGTGSELQKLGLWGSIAGMSSDPHTLPVAREMESFWG